MRPTPDEIAAGVRKLLRDEIAPLATTPDAESTLRRVLATLRDARWNEAAFDLLRENRTLRDLLEACEQRANSRQVAQPPEDAELSTLLVPAEPTSFAAANDLNRRLRSRLARHLVAGPQSVLSLDPAFARRVVRELLSLHARR